MLTEFMSVLPTATDWIHSATREMDVHVVSDFRLTLQNLQLLRKYKNSLRLTAAGEAAVTDRADLWTYLAERLVPGDDDFTGSVGAVILVHMVTAGDRGHGWCCAHDGGGGLEGPVGRGGDSR
ncbi:MAG: hypothetical protein ACRCYQ_12095 [Nocardioides sp.]